MCRAPPPKPQQASACRRFLTQCWTLVVLFLKLAWLVLPQSGMWLVMVTKLILFAVALAPALASSVHYWLTKVRKNVAYGPGPRQLLDIYSSPPPPDEQEEDASKKNLRPVVVFVTGGAWVIGYKAWAVPLGRALAAQGVVVVAPDYRNAPQASVEEMLDDCDRAVAWTLQNVQRYGGDPANVVLAGQSAGAHLCALLLLRKAEREAHTLETWRARAVRGFVGISGPYSVEATAVHWIARGLTTAIFRYIFKGDFAKHSPTDECLRLADAAPRIKVGAALPPICLVHGTADMSAPFVSSELFEARLRLLGADVLPTRKYRDWSHTDPILEKPFSGDHSLHADIFHLVLKWTSSSSSCETKVASFDHASPDCRRLAPQLLIDFGRWCMPF